MGTHYKTNEYRLLYCHEIQIANCSLIGITIKKIMTKAWAVTIKL